MSHVKNLVCQEPPGRCKMTLSSESIVSSLKSNLGGSSCAEWRVKHSGQASARCEDYLRSRAVPLAVVVPGHDVAGFVAVPRQQGGAVSPTAIDHHGPQGPPQRGAYEDPKKAYNNES